MMVRVELVQKEEHMSGNHGFYDGRVGSRISRKPMLEQLRVLETVQTFGGKHSFDHADQEQNLLSASFNIFQLSSKIFQHLSKSVPSSCCCSYSIPLLFSATNWKMKAHPRSETLAHHQVSSPAACLQCTGPDLTRTPAPVVELGAITRSAVQRTFTNWPSLMLIKLYWMTPRAKRQ